jgi:hypothetical protein
MKKILIAISGILLLSSIFLFSGCGSSQTSSPTQPATSNHPNTTNPVAATSAAAVNTPPTGYVLVTSANGNVSISVPSGWNTNDTQLCPGSIIGVADEANKAYLIITEKPKATLKAGDTINDYLNIIKIAFGSVVTNPAWGQPSNVTIGDCKGLTVRLTGTRKSNNTDTVYFINALESKNYFYNVCGYTLTASEEANKANLNKIINSFKEKD